MAQGDLQATRLSNLLNDVEAPFVRAFVSGFVQNVVHLELLPLDTQDAAAAAQAALMTVECSDRELDILQQCVQRGCFGRRSDRRDMPSDGTAGCSSRPTTFVSRR
jgi:hypothetical protein